MFVLGLVTGSFLNACIYRMPRGISLLTPRSRCPRCSNTLGIADLVPVLSYLSLMGKCHRCREKISPRYPLVELACGTGFLILYLKFGPVPEYLAALTLFSGLVAIALIDWEHGIIPDQINLALAVVGVPLLLQSSHALLNGLLGALLGGGLLLLVGGSFPGRHGRR